MPTSRRFRFFAALIAASALLLGACSDDSHDENDGHDHAKLHISSAWVKAADEGMTAAFAGVHNETGSTLTIVSVSTDASARTELHETVTAADHSSMMQEVREGFTLGGAENLSLEPGGNHIMLMDLKRPLLPGDEVTFTVHFDDDTTQDFTAVVKEFDGAQESYEDHGKKH